MSAALLAEPWTWVVLGLVLLGLEALAPGLFALWFGLAALATGTYPGPDTAAEAKRLMREILDHRLEARGIASRRIVRDLLALDEQNQESIP